MRWAINMTGLLGMCFCPQPKMIIVHYRDINQIYIVSTLAHIIYLLFRIMSTG